MNPLIEHLKRQHRFAAWAGCNRLPEHLFVWNYFLLGCELDDWQLHASRPLPVTPERRFIPSVWQRAATGRRDELLRVDAYECASRESAHEFLIELLAQFSAPVLRREEDLDIGDVVFAGGNDAGLVFARANLVFLIANGGRQAVPVREPTRQLDRGLVAKPALIVPTGSPPAAIRAAPEQPWFTHPKSVRVGALVPLTPARRSAARGPATVPIGAAAEADPTAESVCRFFAQTCDFRAADNRVHCRPLVGGAQRIEVYALTRSGESRHQRLELEVAEP